MAKDLKNAISLTAISFLCYFVLSALLAPIGILAPVMAEYFDEPVTNITKNFGWLTTGNLLGALLAVVISSHFPLKTLFAWIYGLIGVLLISVGLVSDLLALGLVLALVGMGCGIGLAAAAILITLRFDAQRKASMLILTDACFSVAGFAIAWTTATLLYFEFGWQSTFQLIGVFALVIAALAITANFGDLSQEKPGAEERKLPWPTSVKLLGAGLFLYTLGQYSAIFWLPIYAEETFALNKLLAGGLVGQFWTGMFAAQIFTSWWVMKIGAGRLVGLAVFTTFAGSVSLWVTPSGSWLPALAALWGFLNFSLLKATLSYATELFPDHPRNLVPMLLLCATGGTAISPLLTSAVVDLFDARGSLIMGSICYALLILCVMLARQTPRAQS